MPDRDELISITMARAAMEALAAAAAVGLGVNQGLRNITAPETAERGLAELTRALSRRGASPSATMSRVEARVLSGVSHDGLAVAEYLPPLAEPFDLADARDGLSALNAAL